MTDGEAKELRNSLSLALDARSKSEAEAARSRADAALVRTRLSALLGWLGPARRNEPGPIALARKVIQ